MATKTLGLGLLLVLAAGGGYYLLRSDPAVPAAPDENATNGGSRGDPARVEPRTAEVKFLADVTSVPRDDRFQLPDGTWAMSLNGVKNAPILDWPPDIPWSPIKRMLVDPQGQEWYEHEDGSMSTTVMTWRTDLGRDDAVTLLANPTDVLPREIDVGPTLPDTGRKQ